MDKITVKTSLQSDIVYHLLAHRDLSGNPSNLYSPLYINKIARARSKSTNWLEDISLLREGYESNFHRLSIVNFIPYYTRNVNELISALKNYQEFTFEDKKNFVEPFVAMLIKEEKNFYNQYWHNIFTKNTENIEAFERYLSANFESLNALFLNTNRKPNIYVSFSMTQFGRGFYMDEFLSAAVPLPNGVEEYESAFFQILHEFTHQLTDSLLDNKIRMDDGTHELSEIIAVVADYYIFNRLDHNKVENYLRWINVVLNERSDELTTENFTTAFSLPKKIHLSLLELVDQICQ